MREQSRQEKERERPCKKEKGDRNGMKIKEVATNDTDYQGEKQSQKGITMEGDRGH